MIFISVCFLFGCEAASTNTNATIVGAPTGVIAIYASKRVTISWVDDPSVYEYGVFRSTTENGDYTLIDYTYVSSEGTDSNVVAGNTYYYRVKAKAIDGTKSDFSDAASVKITCPSFSVSGETVSLDSLSFLNLSGVVKNTGDGTAWFVKVTYYMYKNDIIVDTGSDYPLDSNDFLPGASATYNITFYDLKSLSAYDKYELIISFEER